MSNWVADNLGGLGVSGTPVGESIRDGWWNIDPVKLSGGVRFWEDIQRPREMTAADLGLTDAPYSFWLGTAA